MTIRKKFGVFDHKAVIHDDDTIFDPNRWSTIGRVRLPEMQFPLFKLTKIGRSKKGISAGESKHPVTLPSEYARKFMVESPDQQTAAALFTHALLSDLETINQQYIVGFGDCLYFVDMKKVKPAAVPSFIQEIVDAAAIFTRHVCLPDAAQP